MSCLLYAKTTKAFLQRPQHSWVLNRSGIYELRPWSYTISQGGRKPLWTHSLSDLKRIPLLWNYSQAMGSQKKQWHTFNYMQNARRPRWKFRLWTWKTQAKMSDGSELPFLLVTATFPGRPVYKAWVALEALLGSDDTVDLANRNPGRLTSLQLLSLDCSAQVGTGVCLHSLSYSPGLAQHLTHKTALSTFLLKYANRYMICSAKEFTPSFSLETWVKEAKEYKINL